MAWLTSVYLYMCLVIASFSLGSAIKCHVCDPLKDDVCSPFSKTIDCSTDSELGHAFDSCYTIQMVISDFNGGNFTYEEKNCSIQYGCIDLKDSMCVQFNETSSGAVKSCNIDCCTEDFCNGGKPDFTKVYSETTYTFSPDEGEPTDPAVLARRSGSDARCSPSSWWATFILFSLSYVFE